MSTCFYTWSLPATLTTVCDSLRRTPFRIIEIEWAVKNDKPFNPSPKKHRRAHSKAERSKTSRRRRRPDTVPEEEDEEDDVSAKENVDANPSPGKRHMKMDDAELGTPPKKRRILKSED